MKRSIIYLVYTEAHNFWGCIVIFMTYGLLGIPVLKLFQYFGWHEILASFVWFGGGIILGIHLGKAGRKIEVEKEQLLKWVETMSSVTASTAEKESAGWKILESPELKKHILNLVLIFTYPSTPINDAALDKMKALEKETSIF